MFTTDFSKAPKMAQGSYLFFGGTKYSGLRSLVQLIFVWRRVVGRMKASPGYLGHFVWFRFPATFGNFSIWDSKENMMAFARSTEHRAAIRWLVKPGTAHGAFIRFLHVQPAGHSIGEWRSELDYDAWRTPMMPFSGGTADLETQGPMAFHLRGHLSDDTVAGGGTCTAAILRNEKARFTTIFPGGRAMLWVGMKMILIHLILTPLDLVAAFIRPRYNLYIGFFKITPQLVVARMGRMRAIRAAAHAARKVPAYREFLKHHQVSPQDILRLSLPATDKENYVKRFAIKDRCVNGKLSFVNTAIDESSGSTGTPYNWIRSLKERHDTHIFISHFARYCYGTEPWITINAFSMGAWATGINMGVALERNSIVKNTGPDIDKIFGTLQFMGPDFRYLICGYPPFLKRVTDVALERAFPLEQYRLMALLGGEGNSEGLRDYLSKYFRPVYSGYGATDIEIGLAGETPLSLAIRREARRDSHLRLALFGEDARLPMVFQYNPLIHHIVVNEQGELIFTIMRLDVLAPRVMYNIHDEGGVATFAQVEAKFRSAGLDLGDLAVRTGSDPLRLPFLWIYGRKDTTISVMGANIYPEDIEQCLYEEPELAKLANSFCLSLYEGSGGSVRPCFSFEIRGEITTARQSQFESCIVARLTSLNADFREAMQEYAEAATPLIQLFSMGTGPFSGDAAKIKQTRFVKATDIVS